MRKLVITGIIDNQVSVPGGAGAVAGSGSPALSTVILSEKMEEKIAVIQLQQELSSAKEEVRDLQEKLETLKVCFRYNQLPNTSTNNTLTED